MWLPPLGGRTNLSARARSGAVRGRDPRLRRNCCLNDLTRRKVDKPKSEIIGSLTEATEDVRSVLRVVHVGARVCVHKMVFQGSIHQDRELARGGGDRRTELSSQTQPPPPAPATVRRTALLRSHCARGSEAECSPSSLDLMQRTERRGETPGNRARHIDHSSRRTHAGQRLGPRPSASLRLVCDATSLEENFRHGPLTPSEP
jgi:hypothetical protein